MISGAERLGVVTAGEAAIAKPASVGYAGQIGMVLFIGLLGALSVWTLAPPATAPPTAPAAEFSSARAMKHVGLVAQRPRPVGSAEHARVRGYIMGELAAQGLAAEVQRGTITSDLPSHAEAATVHNVMGRLKGENSAKAVLLVTHYDSVPNSPGASDDAAGIATLLETLRALKSGPPLKNDVIFLFTDGEELYLSGAKAFVKNHPWAKDVGVALNFDVRGTGGPVFMFETSRQNGGLIKKLAKAARYPVAASYMNDIYKALPNDSDLTIFSATGTPGLNFAFIDGESSFHSRVDSLQNLDERSVQHSGAYALALTRELGNSDLDGIKEPDVVYFDLLGQRLVYYPMGLVVVVTAVVVLVFAGLVVIGVKKGHLTILGTVFGVLALVSSLICVLIAWNFIGPYVRSYSPTISAGRTSTLMLLGFIALSISMVAAIYKIVAKKARVPELAVGALFCWLVLLVVSSFSSPGSSYLFAWPLLFSIIPVAWVFVSNKQRLDSPRAVALLTLCAVPGVVLIVPTIYSLYLALGLTRPGILMLLPTLFIALLIPHASVFTSKLRRKWVFIGATALLALILTGVDIGTSGYGASFPKSSSVFYGLNADTGEAVWASTDKRPDEWTSQFFSSKAIKEELSEFFPLGPYNHLNSLAPQTQLAAPVITQIDETESDEVRTLRLRITSPRNASTLEVTSDGAAEVMKAWVDGQPVRVQVYGKRLRLRYFGLPAEGVELKLEVSPSQPFRVRIADYTYGITEGTGLVIKERPEEVMPARTFAWIQDSVAVSKTYTF